MLAIEDPAGTAATEESLASPSDTS